MWSSLLSTLMLILGPLTVCSSAASVPLEFNQNVESSNAGERSPFDTDLFNEPYADHILFVDPADTKDPMINQHKFELRQGNDTKCNSDVFLLNLVKSSPERYSERQNIRDTWASVKRYRDHRIHTMFIMGSVNNIDKQLNKTIVEEMVKYGDIIQGDFQDHFRKQTYKSMMGLTWVEEKCRNSAFVLMTNDETMVDPFHLVDFLVLQSADKVTSSRLLYCSLLSNIGPERNPAEELFVSKFEYPYVSLPPHCEGFAYVMSRDVISDLLVASETVPHLWLDEVYVTGMLPLKAGLKHADMLPGHGYNMMQKEHLIRDIGKAIFLTASHKSLRSNWNTAWDRILDLYKAN